MNTPVDMSMLWREIVDCCSCCEGNTAALFTSATDAFGDLATAGLGCVWAALLLGGDNCWLASTVVVVVVVEVASVDESLVVRLVAVVGV